MWGKSNFPEQKWGMKEGIREMFSNMQDAGVTVCSYYSLINMPLDFNEKSVVVNAFDKFVKIVKIGEIRVTTATKTYGLGCKQVGQVKEKCINVIEFINYAITTGNASKTSDNDAIGKFGEGLCAALMLLEG
eukprot:Pgem_evm1s991